MGKFPRKLKGYKRPECENFFEEKEDAVDCCALFEETEAWQCVECEEIHEDRDDAYNCCG